MTIRQLPKVVAPAMRAGVSFDVMPSALMRYEPEIHAAAQASDSNVISILGSIGSDFFGEGVTARRVSAALRAIGDQPVTLHVNSPGGDYFEGLAIYNLLREHPKPVTVKVLGMAASAASIIAMAGDTIQMPRAGFLMIHNTWVVAAGDRNDLRDYADILEPFDQAARDVYASRTGLAEKDIGKMMDRETWIGGQSAVDQGFADELLPADQVDKSAQAAGEIAVAATARTVEAYLAKAGMPRGDRRRMLAELKSGTPSAAERVTPSADVSADLAATLAEIKIR